MELVINNNDSNIVASYWELLRPLSVKVKLKLASMLTASVCEEESISEKVTKGRRKAKVIRRALNTPSDRELEARFEGSDMPELPADPAWSHVINANTGKTIKPIEKWL